MCGSTAGTLRMPATADCGVSSVCMRAPMLMYVPICLMCAHVQRALFRKGAGHTAWANTSVCVAYRERARKVATGTQVGIMSNSWRLVGGFWENVHRQPDARSHFKVVCPMAHAMVHAVARRREQRHGQLRDIVI